MKYDFIEIGTSNFDTLIEQATETTFGISIEPSKIYLEQLPDKKNVIKINCAISFTESTDLIDFYYIDPVIIKRKNLKPYLRGCNCIGNYHPMHVRHNLQKYVTIQKIEQKTYRSIITDYNITELDFLKIDTEGGDCKIMKQVYNSKDLLLPKKIKFESNSLSIPREVYSIKNMFEKLGYNSTQTKTDTILILNK